ncbi:MAG TPA: DUF192 domain-containing protein [Candidatus Nitrosopolaris sp.]|nr:DUF192 domain-containing protein [Candidatus Nitrosopolaris sp.]
MVHKIAVLVPVMIAAIAVGVLGLLFIPPGVKNAPAGFSVGTVRINHDVIKVEVANSSAEKERWLMFRHEKMPFNSAMILVYDKPDLYSMWLLNIGYNLDLIWFDEHGNVVYMVKDVPPCRSTFDMADCTYKNTKPAKYVVAATAGFIDKHRVNKDSRINLTSI